MARRQPVVRGRGNVAPPVGYRPGLKARWLKPRPINPHPVVPEMPFTLLTLPLDLADPAILNPPDNGVLVFTPQAGTYVDAQCYVSVFPDAAGELQGIIGTDNLTFDAPFGVWQVGGGAAPTPPWAPFLPPSNAAGLVTPGAISLSSRFDGLHSIYFAYYPSALDPTSGEILLQLKIYS